MLNKPDCKVTFDEEGKANGVTSEGETARCKKVVCAALRGLYAAPPASK